MNKCVYCNKEIDEAEAKFESLIYLYSLVCEDCIWKEDILWFTSRHIKDSFNYLDELKKD